MTHERRRGKLMTAMSLALYPSFESPERRATVVDVGRAERSQLRRISESRTDLFNPCGLGPFN
jgi:hypothetical protein